MIPLVRRLVHALLWDELSARRWIRGFFLWAGGAAVMVASVGWEVAQAWTLREWAGRLAIAGILGIGGMITAGEKNPKPAGFAVPLVYVALGAVAALVVAFLAGRYSAPERVKIETKVETKTVTVTEWKDRIVEKRVQGPVRVRTVTIEKPGGERVVERIVDRGSVTTDTATNLTGQSSGTTASTAATAQVSETGRPGWRAAVAAAWSPGRLSLEPERYTAEIDRRLVGTLWLGAHGSTDGTAGLSLSLEW